MALAKDCKMQVCSTINSIIHGTTGQISLSLPDMNAWLGFQVIFQQYEINIVTDKKILYEFKCIMDLHWIVKKPKGGLEFINPYFAFWRRQHT